MHPTRLTLLVLATLLLVAIAPTSAVTPYVENPTIQWQKLLGGGDFEYAQSVQQTSDGGCVLLGNSVSSASGDITGTNHGGYEVWVVKLDAPGAVQWEKLLGGSGSDCASDGSIQQTTDGGYILLGSSDSSASGDVTGISHGGGDFWVVKLSSTGAVQWEKLLGGSYSDSGHSVQQTSDSGYVLLGNSWSSGSGDIAGTNHGYEDFWVVKLNADGAVQWEKLLGGSGYDYGYSVVQTPDDGYVLLGYSDSSASGDITGTNQGGDCWMVKLDADGAVQWQKLLDGGGYDTGFSVQQTFDGGYALFGYSLSYTGTSHGNGDFWMVKLDAAGAVQWQKLLGGSEQDHGYSGQQTSDGGYVLLGYSYSSVSGDITGTSPGGNNFWVVKLDAAGAVLWQKLLGGSGFDFGRSVRQTSDGGYVLLGSSMSSASGDITGTNHGNTDYWVVKLGADSPPSVLAVPGGAGVCTDTNADGLYDDVNGNGRPDFADVVLYFNQMTWIAGNEPTELFDYNGNGRIDFADVVWLFNNL